MEIVWLVLCATTALVNGHPVQRGYAAPALVAAISEPTETPGHADDAFQFAYAVASPEHGTYHGHQATRDQQGHTSGSYYSLGSDGHWRQTVYADEGQGFQALSNQRPAGSPPAQVSTVNYQVFVHPGATAISASGSVAPADLSFFGVKGVGQIPSALRGNAVFFNPFSDDSDEDDSDDDDSDEDDDNSLSLESEDDDDDDDDSDDDIFRQNFRFNLRQSANNGNDENDNDTDNVSLNNEDEDDDEENSLPRLPSTLRSAAQGFISQNTNPTAIPGGIPVQSFVEPTATSRPSAVFNTLNQIPASVPVQSPSSNPFITRQIASPSNTQVNTPNQRFVNRIATNNPTPVFRNNAPLRAPAQLSQTPTPATRVNVKPTSASRQSIVDAPFRTNGVQTSGQTPAGIQSSVAQNLAQTPTLTRSSFVQTPATFRTPTVQTPAAIQSSFVQTTASPKVPAVQTQAATHSPIVQSPTPLRASAVQNPLPSTALSPTSSLTGSSRSAPVFPFAIVPTSAISTASSPPKTFQQPRTQNLIQSSFGRFTQNFPQQQGNAQIRNPTQSLFTARSTFNPTNLRGQSPQTILATTARPTLSSNDSPFEVINRPSGVTETGTLTLGSSAFVPAQNSENSRQAFPTNQESFAPPTFNNNFPSRSIQPTSQSGLNIGSGNQQSSSLPSISGRLSSNASPQRNTNIILTNTIRENTGFTQRSQNTFPIQSSNRSGVASGASETGVPLPLLSK